MAGDRAGAGRAGATSRGSRRTVASPWSAGAIAAAVAAGLAGCGGGATAAPAPTEPTGALAVVVGARANMPPAALDDRSASVVDMAVGQRSAFSLAVADGAPYLDGAAGSPALTDRRSVDEAVAGARARTAGSDLLGALDLAGDALAGQTGLRTLVVLDSGLSTTGALDLTTPGMLDAHPQEVAEALGDAERLPDLSGVRVVLHGLGDTAAPQQPLDPIRRAQLVALWSTVVREAGAVSVHVEPAPLEGVPDPALPPVATVGTDPGYRCAGRTMTLTGGPFAFRPNSDQFLDPAAAQGVLRGIAEQLVAGQVVATLFGTTAAIGEPADQVRFSDERAQAVADLLIALQVPIPQLHVEGLGSAFEGYVTDRDAEGRLLPAAAALNRTVRIEFSAPVTC
ncbi:OmpA family protein [Blastococcus sp. SYSU DS0539]